MTKRVNQAGSHVYGENVFKSKLLTVPESRSSLGEHHVQPADGSAINQPVGPLHDERPGQNTKSASASDTKR